MASHLAGHLAHGVEQDTQLGVYGYEDQAAFTSHMGLRRATEQLIKTASGAEARRWQPARHKDKARGKQLLYETANMNYSYKLPVTPAAPIATQVISLPPHEKRALRGDQMASH